MSLVVFIHLEEKLYDGSSETTRNQITVNMSHSHSGSVSFSGLGQITCRCASAVFVFFCHVILILAKLSFGRWGCVDAERQRQSWDY